MQRACDQDDGAGARVAAISRAEAAGGHRARSLPHCVSRTVAQVEVGDGVQRGAAAALAQQVARRQAPGCGDIMSVLHAELMRAAASQLSAMLLGRPCCWVS